MKARKTVLALLLVVLIMSLFTACGNPQYTSQEARENQFKYKRTESGIVITSYTGHKPIVNIPSKIEGMDVVAIGERAFAGNINLSIVRIPNTVKTIEVNAFQACVNLTMVSIPDSVTQIGDFAFNNCGNLLNITIPNNITFFGSDVFASCLTKVTYKGQTFSPFNYDGLYNTVNSIPTTSYDKLIYDSNPVSASDASDFYCYYSQIEGGIVITKYLGSKSVVNIPSSIDGKPVVKLGTRNVLSKEYGNIGIGVFYECGNVKEITIPDSILSIGERMFVNCTLLQSITIPDNVIAIDEKAFYDCNVSVTYKGKTYSPDEYKTLFDRINS